METIKVLSDLTRILDGTENVTNRHMVFRGQSDCSWHLEPKLSRFESKNCLLLDTETRMLDDFAKLSSVFKADSNKLEIMTLGQHYGLATRLLDWTTNPLIALWFATDQKIETDGSLFIYSCLFNNSLYSRQNLSQFLYPESFFSTNPETPIFFKPYSISKRITNQSSIFSVSKTAHQYNFDRDEEGFDYIPKLYDVEDFMNKIHTINIDYQSKMSLREELNRIGTNRFSIFCDLESLSQITNEKHLCSD